MRVSAGPSAGGGDNHAAVPLRFEGISKRYGKPLRAGRWALRGVDLALPEGSITALVGPNGAGKTTLIRIAMAFERPNAGRIEVGGVDPLRHQAEALRHVGYVPQTPAVYRGLSVEDHLAMARSLRSDFDRDLARRRLEQLGIPLDQRGDTLSGGQAAQLGLAIALGTRAGLLLLDEPLASLDPLARREFIHVLLEAIRAEGSTALLSSHIVSDVEEACDRLVILGAGTVLLDCPIDEARRVHRMTERDTPPAGATEVGSFAGREGRRQTLWRLAAGGLAAIDESGSPDGCEPTSLEDVVLGYLAAGRGNGGLRLE